MPGTRGNAISFAGSGAIRRLFCCGLLLFLLSTAAMAGEEEIAPGEALAIRTVIEAQLNAFGAEDGKKAFSFASPAIRRKFSTSSNFMQMVRQGYPMIYRPQAYDFLETRRRDGITAQAVQFFDHQGKGTIAIYIMERQDDGTWRIDGVRLIEQGGAES